jgi:hypothetical protein
MKKAEDVMQYICDRMIGQQEQQRKDVKKEIDAIWEK